MGINHHFVFLGIFHHFRFLIGC